MQLIAQVGSVEDRQNEYHTHFCNWAQSIHNPLDLPKTPFPRIRSVDELLDLTRPIESSPGLSDKGCIPLVLWHRSATVGRKAIWRWQRRLAGCGLIRSSGVWDHIVLRNF